MKGQLTASVTAKDIIDILKEELPEYGVTLKKNQIFRFEYIEIRKSAFTGAFLKLNSRRNVFVSSYTPALWARVLGGGLILAIFLSSAQNAVVSDIAKVLKDHEMITLPY